MLKRLYTAVVAFLAVTIAILSFVSLRSIPIRVDIDFDFLRFMNSWTSSLSKNSILISIVGAIFAVCTFLVSLRLISTSILLATKVKVNLRGLVRLVITFCLSTLTVGIFLLACDSLRSIGSGYDQLISTDGLLVPFLGAKEEVVELSSKQLGLGIEDLNFSSKSMIEWGDSIEISLSADAYKRLNPNAESDIAYLDYVDIKNTKLQKDINAYFKRLEDTNPLQLFGVTTAVVLRNNWQSMLFSLALLGFLVPGFTFAILWIVSGMESTT